MNYKELNVWNDGIKLSLMVYDATKDFPVTEKYGLVSQMNRCVVSIPSNIAEGSNRRTTRDFISFLYISKGSCAELETQLIIAKELTYVSDSVFNNIMDLVDRIGAMLYKLIEKLEQSISTSHDPQTTGA